MAAIIGRSSLHRGLTCPMRCAEVAELADAQASGACSRKGVEVRVLSSAPNLSEARAIGPFVFLVHNHSRPTACSEIDWAIPLVQVDRQYPRRAMYPFSERLAVVAGIVLPVGETVRRWGSLWVYPWAYLDDVLIGCMFPAWCVDEPPTARCRRTLLVSRLRFRLRQRLWKSRLDAEHDRPDRSVGCIRRHSGRREGRNAGPQSPWSCGRASRTSALRRAVSSR